MRQIILSIVCSVIAFSFLNAQEAPPADNWSSYTLFRKPAEPPKMVVDGFLWVEAEDFANYGDWRLDTQFVQQMGSAYLIAAGVGCPIADASTEVNIPKAAEYKVWVRAKNWILDHAPGKFTVLVNGKQSEHVFGAAKTEDWIWESAGQFQLPAGKTKIELHDLTGYFGRCDAILLASDLSYTPPKELGALTRERARLRGVSLDPVDEGQFDVVVVGAGAAGCCAAVSSARLGAKTALIQDRPCLGGNASDELGVGICGASARHANARESGVMEEAGREKAFFPGQRMSEGFRIVAERERNLKIFYNRRVVGAEMRDAKQIESVTAVDTLTGRLFRVRAKLFIDCTGDGWLGYYAGAKFRLGRESSEEFGEDLAPPAADKITMSGCLMGNYTLSFRAKNVGHKAPFAPPAWAPKLPADTEASRRIKHYDWGEWWLEHPGEVDDLWEPERARDELIKISFAYWDFLKNHWSEKEKTERHALSFVPFMNAKRETRRLIGDYLFKQQDAQAGTMFPDRIAYGGWTIDVHHPKGIFSGKEGPYYCDARVPLYSIPFRILYSVNVDNLLFAGRHVSTTHIGLGTLRVQGTLSLLGQAAGTAAAMCLERKCSPRELGQKHITALQQTLLKHDQYIPELKNEDPADLARTATVTASSAMEFDEFTRGKISHRESHPLNMPRAVMLPRGRHERIDNMHVLLFSDRKEPVEVTLHVREAAAPDDYSSTKDVATAKAKVVPGRLAYVKFPVNCTIRQPYVWLWLPKTEGVAWRMMEKAPFGSSRAYGGDSPRGWTSQSGQYYACFFDPAISLPCDFRPENVIDGVARIVGTVSHQWASDAAKPMPQWIELKFPKPAKLNTVYLTFDTEMNSRSHDQALVPQCVKDYRLEAHDGQKWVELAAVEGNYQRRRTHRFPEIAAEKLRLTVTATNGDPSARVFEVRAYRE